MSGPFVTCRKCGYGNVNGFDACENCGSLLPRQQQPAGDRSSRERPFDRSYQEPSSFQEQPSWGGDATAAWDQPPRTAPARQWPPDNGRPGQGDSYGTPDSYNSPGSFGSPGRHGRDESYVRDESFGRDSQFGRDESFGRDSQFGRDESFGRDTQFGRDESFGRDSQFGRDESFGRDTQFGRDESFGRDSQFGRDEPVGRDGQFGYDPFGNGAGVSVSVALRMPNGRTVNLAAGDRVILGRGKESPLAELATDNISRVHAVLTIQRDGAFLTDEGSTNGTYLNGNQLQPHREYRVQGAAVVALGTDPPLRFRVEVSE